LNRKTLIAITVFFGLAATTGPVYADFASGNGNKFGHSNNKGKKKGHAKQDARFTDEEPGEDPGPDGDFVLSS